MSGRTHASQGEQRSLVLALRLAGHELVTGQGGSAPILLLDDVFSELDAARSEALLACVCRMGRPSSPPPMRPTCPPGRRSPCTSGSRTGSCSHDDLAAAGPDLS